MKSSVGANKVVLVHGLWVHGVLMELQRRALARAGFNAICYSYPSVRLTLTQNAERLAQFARALAAPHIHWVGHSLGGLVILRMLEREATVAPGRVVLEGVPYCDSFAGRMLGSSRFGAHALGRSMREWLDARKPTDFDGREIGVIAGARGIGLGRLFAPGLPAPNDGAVAVAETALAAATDRIVLAVSHSGMLVSRVVARQICAFLHNGCFDRGAA